MGGGLVQFDDARGEAVDIDTIVGRREALGDRRVMALQLDRHGTLWIGTMTSGLEKLTPRSPAAIDSGQGRRSAQSQRGRDHDHLRGARRTPVDRHPRRRGQRARSGHRRRPPASLCEQVAGRDQRGERHAHSPRTPQGNMWIGTDDGGLDLARADGTVIKVFRHDPADPASLPSNTVYALEADADGRIWVATDGGGLAQRRGHGRLARRHSIQVPLARRRPVERHHLRCPERCEGTSLAERQCRSDAPRSRHPRRQDLSSRTRTAGRGIRLQRLSPPARRPAVLRRTRRIQHLRSAAPVGERARAARGVDAPRGPGRAGPERHPVLAAATASPSITGPTSCRSTSARSISSRRKRNRLAYRVAGLSDQWIDLGTQHRVTLTNLDAGDHLLEVRAANCGFGVERPAAAADDSPRSGAVALPLGVRVLCAADARLHRLPPAICSARRSGASSRASSAWSPRSRCARANWSKATGSSRRPRGPRATSWSA